MRFNPLLDELFTPGHAITGTATAPLTLGQFAAVAPGEGIPGTVSVTVATAGARAFGLAQDDAATGEKVGIQRGNGRCFRVPTTATIGAGADIEVGADGKPAPHTDGVVVAQALHASNGKYVDLTLI